VTRGNEYTNEVIFAGISDKLIRRIEKLAPNEFEMRNVVLGHTQRGGSPIADDRILSTRFGTRAVEAYEKGHFGHMVALQRDEIVTVPLEDAVNQLKLVTTDNMIYQAAVHMGVFLGDATYSERHAKTHLLDA
jgi:6-phosphofructokinase 1